MKNMKKRELQNTDESELEDATKLKRVALPFLYRPNTWAEMVLILARDSIKGHQGNFTTLIPFIQ